MKRPLKFLVGRKIRVHTVNMGVVQGVCLGVDKQVILVEHANVDRFYPWRQVFYVEIET